MGKNFTLLAAEPPVRHCSTPPAPQTPLLLQRLLNSRLGQRRHNRVPRRIRMHTVVAQVPGQPILGILQRRVVINESVVLRRRISPDPRIQNVDLRRGLQSRRPRKVVRRQ